MGKPKENEAPKGVIITKFSRTEIYHCSECGESGTMFDGLVELKGDKKGLFDYKTGAKLYSRKKERGCSTGHVILCSDCRSDEIAEAKTRNESAPKMFPLHDQVRLDLNEDEKNRRLQEKRRQILGNSKPDKARICFKCYRYHGEEWDKPRHDGRGNFLYITNVLFGVLSKKKDGELVLVGLCTDCGTEDLVEKMRKKFKMADTSFLRKYQDVEDEMKRRLGEEELLDDLADGEIIT